MHNKFKHAAWQILHEAAEPLHYVDITRLAFERGLLKSEGKTPEASMNAQLVTDVNANGAQSAFVKVAPATYALNAELGLKHSPFITEVKSPQTKPSNHQKIKVSKSKMELAEQIALDKLNVDGSFVGKSGEHWVCAELLARGFNASIMCVDVGMDIIATRNNQLYSLQVKTARLSKANTYIYDLREVSLARGHSGVVFYVFVMFDAYGHRDCAIIPSHKLDELIHNQAVKSIPNAKVRVTLKVREDELYLGTMDHVVTYYWNNWTLIK